MERPTTAPIINTAQTLELIHKAILHSRINDEPALRSLIDSAISILILYLRKPSARVKPEQFAVIERLKLIAAKC